MNDATIYVSAKRAKDAFEPGGLICRLTGYIEMYELFELIA